MKKSFIVNSILFALLILALTLASLGCDAVRGGAQVTLEGISMGTLTMDGKPVQGLPSGKVNIILKVASNDVKIRPTENGAVITLAPTNATVTIAPTGVSFSGIDSDKVEVKWQTATK
jgi:hypothetical protein